MPEDEKSLTWIVVAAALVVVVFGWGFLAGSYAGAHETALSEMSADEFRGLDARALARPRRSIIAAFVGNSLEQLPNMPTVISWHFANRMWLPMTIGIVMLGVIGGGLVLKKVEQNLAQPKHRRRR